MNLYHTLKRRKGLVAALLFEPESQTYSLSRAQFFWWMAIIAFGYVFLFFGHGLHQGVWGFPPLSGFAYTFAISLGTLLVAQGTPEQVAAVAGSHTGGFLKRLVKPARRGNRRRAGAKVAAAA